MIDHHHRGTIDRVARAILNARGARRGVPAIVNIERLVGPAIFEAARDDAVAALEALFMPIDDAPSDGSGFLAYGRHDEANGKHWSAGDHFWSILLRDVWRFGAGPAPLVFAKDGAPAWSTPTHFLDLFPPKLGDVDHVLIAKGAP